MNKLKVLLLPVLLLLSCKATENNFKTSETLISIDNKAIPTEDFLYIYSKNNFNNDSLYSEADINNYLDLFINFKLKVREAKALGLHNTQEFKDELEGYRQQLAKPYLTETEVTQKLIKEAYERLKTEVNASHILISLPPEAEPADTLEAYRQIQAIKTRAKEAESFAELAITYSDDPSAKMNGGNLGYFTALQMVYPFEDAAYHTTEGKISEPVRTKFGYHIIKVNDKRPSQGKVKVSHIMIRATDGISKEDSIAAREKIYEIYGHLQEGANWPDMAKQFSDDISTKSAGGSLPWFGTGNMIPSFEEAAFALDSAGEISKPVKSPYGWHIIRLDEKQGLEPFEVMEPSLKIKVSKDSRSELNRAALIKKLKTENKFVEHREVLDLAINAADSSLSEGAWNYEKEDENLNEVVFEIKDKIYTLEDFFQYVQEKQKPRKDISPERYMQILYDDFTEASILAYEEAHLADKYEDYRMLLKEYHDGILLFELMDEKVWSKAIEDTAGLRNFFNANRNNYQWEERIKATIYSAANEEVLEELIPMLQKAYLPDSSTSADSLKNTQINKEDSLFLTPEALEKRFNKNSPLTLEIEEGNFEKGDNIITDKIKWQQGTYTIEYDGRVNYVIVEKVLEAGPKKLSEIKGQVISDYQAYLEKQWIAALKEKYLVEVNQTTLKKIYQKFETKQ